MNQGRAVFSQLISFLPDREFRRCVERYQGDSRLRGFSCWDQYLSMAFAQLTYRESLRDIEACLHSVEGKLYHLIAHCSPYIREWMLQERSRPKDLPKPLQRTLCRTNDVGLQKLMRVKRTERKKGE